MSDLKGFEQEIQPYIKLTTLPLAIKLLTSEKQVPEKTRRPMKDFQKRFAICQAVGMSRRIGWTFALGKEDPSCPLTQASLGFEEVLPFLSEGNLCEEMYTGTNQKRQEKEQRLLSLSSNLAGINTSSSDWSAVPIMNQMLS